MPKIIRPTATTTSRFNGTKVGVYDSKFEAVVGKTIEYHLGHHAKPDKAACRIPFVIHTNYEPDFVLGEMSDGRIMLIEAKGYMEASCRRKYVAFAKEHSDTYELRFVFQNASRKITKGSKTTYGGWATKNGFVWSEGYVPDDWYSEVEFDEALLKT